MAHTDDTTREGENERIEYLIQLLHEFDFPLVPLFVHRHRVRHNIFAVKIFKWTTIFFFQDGKIFNVFLQIQYRT